MARAGLAVSGKSLSFVEGLAGLSPSDRAYIVRRGALAILSIWVLIAGLAAMLAALEGVADPGVVADGPGSTVSYVSPTGYGWRAGIREGQTVVYLQRADDPAGWRLETLVGNQRKVAIGSAADARLRESLPLAIAGLALAYMAILFLRTRRRWVLPAACGGLVLAATPLMLAGGQDLATTVMASAAAVPLWAFAVRAPFPSALRGGLVVLVIALASIWTTTRLLGLDAYEGFEQVRGSIALWGTVALIVERVVLPLYAGQRVPLMRPRVIDIAFIGALSAMVLLLLNVLDAAPMVVAGLTLLAVIALPVTRRRFARGLEDALLGDVREAAAAEAAEAERARLARELHDVPLQELVAVIRRLEIKPGTEAESEDLRTLAGHLRNVATELRPPVLDDLGLPAAIDYLAEQTTTQALPVTADVTDETGFGAERRPPASVELAMYRIASEAVGNAIRHAGGSRVSIRASVAPHRVDLLVADDGTGLDDGSAREAAKRKRLGLASMRRRAQAIDAELSINGSPRGTDVRVVWQA